MAKQLIAASLTKDLPFFHKILNEIRYRLKRNHISYVSHRKRTIREWNESKSMNLSL